MTYLPSIATLNQDIAFRVPEGGRLVARATRLALAGQPGAFSDCRLTLSVPPALYRRIERDALFHLDENLGAWPGNEKLAPNTSVTIELALQPDRLVALENDLITDEVSAARHLRALTDGADDADDASLLHTDSWLCLSVSQRQGDRDVGYQTFWGHLDPGRFHASNRPGELLVSAIVDFVGAWTKSSLSRPPGDGDVIDRMLDSITGFLGDLADDAADRAGIEAQALVPGQPLYRTMLDMFRADGWPVSEIEGASAVSLSFRGVNGRWACLAQAREAEAQLLFYSICPVAVQEAQLPAAAEMIARANAGLILGNFELDYDDGEIRFKTSIDVEGDRLTTALARRMVHANVATTDQYLPALRAVLDEGVAPAEAIARIEDVH